MILSGPVPPLEDIGTRLIAPVKEGPQDIIPGFLPARGQLVIAGETDIGKSLIALEVCSSLVTGAPLWGELQPTKQARKILYILGEHYNEVIQRLWQLTKLPMTDNVFIMGPEQLGPDKWLVAAGKQNPIGISKIKVWAEGCDLIVFDPLAAFITGIDIENDNTQMRLLLDSMSLITQSTGASCLILAHQGKPMMDKFGQEHHRKSYAIRGASAIEDASTNIFYMGHARDGASQAAQQVTTDQKVFVLTRRKYKGTAPAEYRLLRDPSTLCHTLLGNRPYVEVQKISTQAKLVRLQQNMPGLSYDDAIKYVAAIEGKDVATIRRWMAV